jgi:pSer/pThr/pTyr-binding forkhead associated (FHA) protein
MRKEQENRIDPAKPALIVLYGATKRRCRPLEAEVTVLGRNPTCDVGLVSPEVAPVHCIIVRLADGWRIRDCSGRATRVNGKAVQDERLNNGDVIQIGTFSFEAHLPPTSPSANGLRAPAAAAAPPPAEQEVDVEHVQASRRRLAEHALGMRRKLHEAQQQRRELEQREQDLQRMEQRLRAATQERQGERAEAQARLDHRKAELDHFAKHLRRQEQKLREQERQQAKQIEADRAAYEADLVRERAELERERREAASLRHQVMQRHVELEQTAAALEEALSREKEQLEKDREQVVRERSYLAEQRQELIQMRAELERRPVAPATSEDTRLDDASPDRLASARRLLRQLADRRRALAPRQE